MTLLELFAAVHDAIAENWPGHVPIRITIQLHDSAEPLAFSLPPTNRTRLASPALSAAEVNSDAASDVAERGRVLHACIRDILETIREAGRPLTKTRLLEELEKKRRFWGESTVCKYLKVLMDDGTIVNPEGERKRGYRLPEWEVNEDDRR